MTKAVSITSLEAYRNNEHYFKNVQQGQVLRLIYENPHLTRLELHLLSIEKNEEDSLNAERGLINREDIFPIIPEKSVCGRVRELLEKPLVLEGEARKHANSKDTAKTLYMPENPDWNLIHIKKNKDKVNKMSFTYDEVIITHKLIKYFKKNNLEIIKAGIKEEVEDIIDILKLEKKTKGVYEKYGNN